MLGGVVLALPGSSSLLGRVLLTPLQRLCSISGLLAAQRLRQNSKRISASASVLLIGAWAAVTVSSTNFGLRGFTDEWEASENVWDVTITGPGPSPFTGWACRPRCPKSRAPIGCGGSGAGTHPID